MTAPSRTNPRALTRHQLRAHLVLVSPPVGSVVLWTVAAVLVVGGVAGMFAVGMGWL